MLCISTRRHLVCILFAHQREISTHRRSVRVCLGKDVGTERMHRGLLSDQQQQQLDCALFLQVLLRNWRQN